MFSKTLIKNLTPKTYNWGFKQTKILNYNWGFKQRYKKNKKIHQKIERERERERTFFL